MDSNMDHSSANVDQLHLVLQVTILNRDNISQELLKLNLELT